MTVVRSCVLPACPARREVPADAYACPDCHQRLVRLLADVETYLTIVSPVPGRGEPGIRAKGYGSRPPARLDVVAALDPRTAINGDGPDDRLDEVPNIHEDIAGWTLMLSEEHPDHPVIPRGVIACAALLRSRCDWICRQSWVDEFAADLARDHGALRQACGDSPSKPFADCPEVCEGAVCGGPVAMHADGEGAQCRRCRASWRRDQLLELMARVNVVNPA